MTLRLPKKPRTTVRGPIIPARTQASLAIGLTLLLGSIALGQQQGPVMYKKRPKSSDFASATTPAPDPSAPALLPPAISTTSPDALPVVSSPTPVQAQWIAQSKSSPAIQQTGGQSLSLVAMQNPMPRPGPASEDARTEYQVEVVPPGLERLSRLDSDAKLQERIRQETIERTDKEQVVFPEEPVLSLDAYMGRMGLWPVREMTVEPYYVHYKKLYFQQNNVERYGWDLGPISPLVCLGKFYYDVATVPLKFAARPCERDASTGYCLPGDPVPLLLYPPEITLSGVTIETAVILALVAIFP